MSRYQWIPVPLQWMKESICLRFRKSYVLEILIGLRLVKLSVEDQIWTQLWSRLIDVGICRAVVVQRRGNMVRWLAVMSMMKFSDVLQIKRYRNYNQIFTNTALLDSFNMYNECYITFLRSKLRQNPF